MWRIDAPKRTSSPRPEPVTMTITTLRRLPRVVAADVNAEAAPFLQFASPDGDHVVRFESVS
jgi:hypothetical protein